MMPWKNRSRWIHGPLTSECNAHWENCLKLHVDLGMQPAALTMRMLRKECGR